MALWSLIQAVGEVMLAWLRGGCLDRTKGMKPSRRSP